MRCLADQTRPAAMRSVVTHPILLKSRTIRPPARGVHFDIRRRRQLTTSFICHISAKIMAANSGTGGRLVATGRNGRLFSATDSVGAELPDRGRQSRGQIIRGIDSVGEHTALQTAVRQQSGDFLGEPRGMTVVDTRDHRRRRGQCGEFGRCADARSRPMAAAAAMPAGLPRGIASRTSVPITGTNPAGSAPRPPRHRGR